MKEQKKVVRYFNAETDTDPKDNQSVEVYNVKVKKKPWGRRREDDLIAKKKKQFNHKNTKIKSCPVTEKKFVGRVPVPEETLKKYTRGKDVDIKSVKTKYHQNKIELKEKKRKFATEHAARVEVLLAEDDGFLKAEPGETTTQFTQQQILENVDITAATKHFELKLTDFGPYRAKYTRNGRHLLLAGKKGHVAAFDWLTKKLHCEINVMETVYDMCWLQNETWFAVAQKDWVYVYDKQGIEMHCLKRMNRVTRLEYLPYHWLLAGCSEEGYLSWFDISLRDGLVTQYNTKLGRLTMLTQNPYNGVLCVGHAKGVVSMWSPNSNEPLAKMLCHKAPMTSLHVDPKGMYMVTAAVNREVKIWDIRKLEGPLQEYKPITAATNVALSQKYLLALGMGNVVEVYRDSCIKPVKRAYMRHRFNSSISNFDFCPFDDVLGVGTGNGFTSLLIPGAGEANFDALEANPFQSVAQRQESEVKGLLEKIQPEFITLDPISIGKVETDTLIDKLEQKKKLLHLKPPKVKYEPRNKAKGKGGSVKMAKNKKIVQEQAKKEFIKNAVKPQFEKPAQKEEPKSIFDRFKSKKR